MQIVEMPLILSLVVAPIVFGGIAICAYYGKCGIRAHVRRKSWCRKMGYKLIKDHYKFGYNYVGMDKKGNLHQIPNEIYPNNTVILYQF